MNSTFHLLLLITLIHFIISAKILGIFHGYSSSHQQLGNKILCELAERGHQVTAIIQGKFAPKLAVTNYKPIVIEYGAFLRDQSSTLYKTPERGLVDQIRDLHAGGVFLTELFFNQTSVQNLLKSNQEFDMVILEQFVNEAFKGFCYYYKAHCVVVYTVGSSRSTNLQMGNPLNPSYMPDVLLNYSSKMNFVQRLFNSFAVFFATLTFYWTVLPKHNEILQKNFPGAPYITELYYETSLILLNSHVGTSSPVPLLPNMIEIGGFHLNSPKRLPKDLQTYLDEGKDGVIYFSMGSNLKGKDMEEGKRNAILKVFSKLKQRVLWKWENETVPDQPNNVKLGKWMPQQDILAHPNIKLFVTHGGLLSIIEAVYHGIPIVGIPIFGDQGMNVAIAKADGYGKVVEFSTLTEENFGNAVTEVLNNPKYLINAKRRSKVMRDQPIKPLDKAMFWIEYVLRHNGAHHLRTKALNLHWFELLCLDVTLFVILIVCVTVFATYKIVKLACRENTKKLQVKKSLKRRSTYR